MYSNNFYYLCITYIDTIYIYVYIYVYSMKLVIVPLFQTATINHLVVCWQLYPEIMINYKC